MPSISPVSSAWASWKYILPAVGFLHYVFSSKTPDRGSDPAGSNSSFPLLLTGKLHNIQIYTNLKDEEQSSKRTPACSVPVTHVRTCRCFHTQWKCQGVNLMVEPLFSSSAPVSGCTLGILGWILDVYWVEFQAGLWRRIRLYLHHEEKWMNDFTQNKSDACAR